MDPIVPSSVNPRETDSAKQTGSPMRHIPMLRSLLIGLVDDVLIFSAATAIVNAKAARA